MPRNKKKKYTLNSSNMTVKEASDYWDSHSFMEFDDIKEVSFDVRLEKEQHYILLDHDVARKIELLAKKKNKPRHILVNTLLKKTLTTLI